MTRQIQRNISRRAFLWIAVIGNLLASPLYWQELMPLAQIVVQSPTGALVSGAVAAFLVSALVAFSWSRGLRIGASAQIAALLLPLSRMVSTSEGQPTVPGFADVADPRFTVALVLTCVVPGVLIAISTFALRRRAKKPNGT